MWEGQSATQHSAYSINSYLFNCTAHRKGRAVAFHIKSVSVIVKLMIKLNDNSLMEAIVL